MSSDKDVVHQDEHAAPAKKRGCAGHCKKFWWAYLIGFIIIAVLIVVLIIFVAVPKIAQKKMDEAELTLDSIVITNPKPDSYNMAVNSTIRTGGGIHAKIDPFEGVMYLTDVEPREVFATVNFPQTESVEVLGVNISQTVEVSDMAAFTRFNTWLLANETLRLTIEGETSVRVKGLDRGNGVTFKKTVELKGINGFHGLKVTDANVNMTAATNNFQGTVDIPNASILTIEIGNATFHNLLDGEEIGTAYLDDLTLFPGVNTVPIRADVEQLPVLRAIAERPACENGIVGFEMTGKDVVHTGERLAYFADALAQLKQEVDIPLAETFAENGLDISCGDEKGGGGEEEEPEADAGEGGGAGEEADAPAEPAPDAPAEPAPDAPAEPAPDAPAEPAPEK